MFENTEGAIKKGKSTDTGNIEERRKSKQKHTTIWVGHHYAQTKTNNVNKTCYLLQRTGGKDEPNIVFIRKSLRPSQHGTRNVKTNNRKTQTN